MSKWRTDVIRHEYLISGKYNIASAGAVDREFVYIIYWARLDPSVFQFGSNWSRIGSNWVPSGLHLGPRDPTGPIWDPTGSRARFGELASSQVRCLRTRSAFSELVTESAEVVAGPAARTPIPHAPGARMTVVTLTPSNYM